MSSSKRKFIDTDTLTEKLSVLNPKKFRMNGYEIWPVLRIAISIKLNPVKKLKQNILKNVFSLLKAFIQVFLKDYKNHLKPKKADIILISNHETRSINYNNCKYNQLTDPLISYLESNDWSVFPIEVVWETARIPRYSKSHATSNLIVRIYGLAYRFISKFQQNIAINFPPSSLDQINNIFKLENSTNQIRKNFFIDVLTTIYHKRNYWLKKLKETRPKLVIMTTYFHNFDIVWACKEMKIPCYDLQHGVIAHDNIGYGNFNDLVSGAPKTLVPDGFLCWDEDNAEIIKKGTTDDAEISINVIGNPLHNMWFYNDGPSSFTEYYNNLVEKKLAGDKRFLISLQWGFEDNRFELLKSIVLESPAEWQWWIRLHPLQLGIPHECDKVYDLKTKRPTTIIEAATTSPLPAILRHMDAHLTYHSSTAIEAEWHGVPSVLLHPLSESYYQKTIHRGHAKVILHEDVNDIISQLSVLKRFEPTYQGDQDNLNTLLLKLISNDSC